MRTIKQKTTALSHEGNVCVVNKPQTAHFLKHYTFLFPQKVSNFCCVFHTQKLLIMCYLTTQKTLLYIFSCLPCV